MPRRPLPEGFTAAGFASGERQCFVIKRDKIVGTGFIACLYGEVSRFGFGGKAGAAEACSSTIIVSISYPRIRDFDLSARRAARRACLRLFPILSPFK